jgi:hypothetical protein
LRGRGVVMLSAPHSKLRTGPYAGEKCFGAAI